MASFFYAVMSITNVASVHCSVRPEISPCTCEPVYAHNYIELSCEKVDSFHRIVDALSNKFESYVNISLKISYSQLEDLEMRSFKDMNLNVVKLRMQWNNLKSVPELPFRGLSNVEFLSVGDNELDEIPKHMLNHMPIIKTFDMGRCRVRSVLQDDFKGIQMVTNLFLPSNNITRLEKGAFPPGLVTLHLGRNQIEDLNGTLRDLNKLESIFINVNSISNLDNELPESNRLKLIIAQNNRIDHLPESMRNMNKLEILHIQFNRIKSLDSIFSNARNLNQFYAFNNEIDNLAKDEFQSSENLEELDLSFNRIKSLNSSLLPLRHLYRANFSYNEIEEFSMNEIRGLKYLKIFDLSHNRIKKLTGHQENSVERNSFLKELSLDHNELKSLDGALMNLHELRILSLTYNQLERILPEDFIGLGKLEILELSHNQILTLKEMETTSLPSLRVLKVAYNNLTKLDRDFYGLPILCQVNLTNNQISSISEKLVSNTRCMNHNVPGVLELHLDDNPIMCDERLNDLCQSMPDQKARIRGRSQCFESDQEVCTVLPLLFNLPTTIIHKSINDKMLVKDPPVLKVIIPVINNDEALRPFINKLIISPAVLATVTTTTTTTTTPEPSTGASAKDNVVTSMPKTDLDIPMPIAVSDLDAVAEGLSKDTAVNNLHENNTETTNFHDSHDNDTLVVPDAKNTGNSIETSTASTSTTTMTTTTTSTSDASKILDIMPPDSPTLVLDIEAQSALPANYTDTTVIHGDPPIIGSIKADATPNSNANSTASSLSMGAPQTEYATVEYIPNLDGFISAVNHPQPPVPPAAGPSAESSISSSNTLEEDSKSNSVNEEFPSVVLADLDTAPQSLLMPEEPPENP